MAIRDASRPYAPPLPALLVVCSAAFGCRDMAPDADRGAADAESADPSALRVDARYLTHLAFAGSDGRLFYGSFDQTAERGRLERAYGVWWAGADGWQSLVETRDTIPVARAGWRLLPARPMTVRIGDAGQIVSVAFSPDDESESAVRLQVGEEVSAWTGPTGQRESLGIAVIHAEGRASLGVLFFRRAARALGIPPSAPPSRSFVLADSIGNGLLIHEGGATGPSVVHAWLHGALSSWTDLVLEPADSVGRSARWSFEIPGTELRGNLRTRPLPADGSPVVAVECILYAGSEQFRFTGLTTELPSP